MNKIKFSKNWNNKLNCLFFTTIRLATKEKVTYYESNVGNTFEVKVENDVHSKAILKTTSVLKLCELKHQLVFLDAGMNYIDFCDMMKKMYGKRPEWEEYSTKVLILLFRNIWFKRATIR